MGMANSAQAFQRLVESVLGDLEGCFVYLDDILCYSKSEEDHKVLLEEVFKRLDKAGLSLALGKCEFGQESVNYLGYKVDKTGLAPLKKKVEALEKFPAPSSQKEMLAFLGALNYYRASLPRLKPSESVNSSEERTPAAVLDPLYKIATCKIEKGTKFVDIWNSSQRVQEAFVDAKALLSKAVTLNFPIHYSSC